MRAGSGLPVRALEALGRELQQLRRERHNLCLSSLLLVAIAILFAHAYTDRRTIPTPRW